MIKLEQMAIICIYLYLYLKYGDILIISMIKTVLTRRCRVIYFGTHFACNPQLSFRIFMRYFYFNVVFNKGIVVGGVYALLIMPLSGPSCKLRFARISAKLRFQDGPSVAICLGS